MEQVAREDSAVKHPIRLCLTSGQTDRQGCFEQAIWEDAIVEHPVRLHLTSGQMDRPSSREN